MNSEEALPAWLSPATRRRGGRPRRGSVQRGASPPSPGPRPGPGPGVVPLGRLARLNLAGRLSSVPVGIGSCCGWPMSVVPCLLPRVRS